MPQLPGREEHVALLALHNSGLRPLLEKRNFHPSSFGWISLVNDGTMETKPAASNTTMTEESPQSSAGQNGGTSPGTKADAAGTENAKDDKTVTDPKLFEVTVPSFACLFGGSGLGSQILNFFAKAACFEQTQGRSMIAAKSTSGRCRNESFGVLTGFSRHTHQNNALVSNNAKRRTSPNGLQEGAETDALHHLTSCSPAFKSIGRKFANTANCSIPKTGPSTFTTRRCRRCVQICN
jgi:hypothetical protein